MLKMKHQAIALKQEEIAMLFQLQLHEMALLYLGLSTNVQPIVTRQQNFSGASYFLCKHFK